MTFRRRVEVQVQGLDVSNLRVKFKVDRTLSRTPSHAEVEIYNLAATSQEQILSAEKGAIVVLLAGYFDQSPHMLFTGTLREVERKVEGPDSILRISSDDGVPKVPRIAKSFRPGSSLSDALDTVTKQAGLSPGNTKRKFKNLLKKQTIGGAPLTIRGGTDVALDAILAATGIEWSVQDNQLLLLESGQVIQAEATALNPDTGLIGSPIKGEGKRIKAKSLIIPGLSPGRLVNIQSREYDGFYKIESASFRGDNYGQEWYVDLECLFQSTSDGT